MKRLLIVLTITMTAICSLQAAQVSESQARQVAEKFFSSASPRFAVATQPTLSLAYTAEQDHFYIYNRGVNSGFVVVAGDDRLPQVLGYGQQGTYSTANPAMQYWMDEMNRQIAFLQAHSQVAVHQPIEHDTAVDPLMTTLWDQGAPYNNLCPTYGDGLRAVTGCVATATAQVMNYHQWPAVGKGSHSYVCNVNDMTPTELFADFSQSVYRWDLMLDTYDASSSAESCEAVAKLMSDVGISMDMGYGSSSGAHESVAMDALKKYFSYSDKCYILNRDAYNAQEWDKFLVDEISARRPVIYCGYSITGMESGGHAFVLDGFDTRGYFHVNWGWGGSSDGYFLVSLLAPSSGMNFAYMQDGIFGLVPEPNADVVEDVLYIRSQLVPLTHRAALGEEITLNMDNFMAEGNMLDTAGYEVMYGRTFYYANIPMSLGVFDANGVQCQQYKFTHRQSLGANWWSSGQRVDFDLSSSLEDGEYKIKLAYDLDENGSYDNKVRDFSGQELYVRMNVTDGIAYLSDCFLYNTYSLDSFVLPTSITIDEPFSVDVKMSYPRRWSSEDGPVGNVYLSLIKDGDEVASSELCEVMIPSNTVQTYRMQLMAPAEWGRYELVLKDESGNEMMMLDEWSDVIGEARIPVFVFPPCERLVEDFESMTANSSTGDKNVQGQFTTWSFTKSGVRAPGEDRCNGTNSVMMKKPSTFYSTQPLNHDFFMAQATFFNPATSAAKYTMDYSLDGGVTWQPASTLDGESVTEIAEKSRITVMWMLNLTATQPVHFRIAMIGGGTASTYVDDFILYYNDVKGDVNVDGEINIADANAVIDVILTNGTLPTADVNGDGEVNIADINAVIDRILN